MRHEWARRAEDVLWRRSKLGLRVTPEQRQRLDDFMQAGSALAHGMHARHADPNAADTCQKRHERSDGQPAP